MHGETVKLTNKLVVNWAVSLNEITATKYESLSGYLSASRNDWLYC